MDISQIAFKGGVPTYTKMLSEQLDKSNQLDMIYFFSSLRKSYQGNLKNVKQFRIPPTILQILFNQLRVVSIENFIGEVDIFHSSDWTQPPTKAKKVTTYHDVIPLKYPQWSHPKIVEVHKKRLQIVEKEIDQVIAVSNTTKQDLLEVSNIPEEKIIVIYEGVSLDFFNKYSEEALFEFKKKYNLPEKFVLSIGGIGERRNLKRVKEAAEGYQLIITGENIPHILDEEMPLLYSSAKVLLYPSFYEGFGLPILEAMACGTPVITSNLGAMSEIAGKGNALLVNPNDIKEIKSNLKTLMEDDQMHQDISGKGILHASKFKWENCASETIDVYRSLMK